MKSVLGSKLVEEYTMYQQGREDGFNGMPPRSNDKDYIEGYGDGSNESQLQLEMELEYTQDQYQYMLNSYYN
jgi:hypothetical protein